jgi:hypothetical protein
MLGSNRKKRGPRGLQGPGEIYFSANTVTTTTTVRYLPVGYTLGTAPSTPTPLPMNVARVVTTLRYRARLAGSGSGSLVITLRREGVATALVLTVLLTATSGLVTLPAGIALAAGDSIDIEVTKTGTVTTAPTDIAVTLS